MIKNLKFEIRNRIRDLMAETGVKTDGEVTTQLLTPSPQIS